MMYEYWLAKANGISTQKKRMLREKFGSAKDIYNNIEETKLLPLSFIGEKELHALLDAKNSPFEEEFEEMERKGIRFIPCFSEEYPKRLKEISGFPYAIYVKGELPEEGKVTAAIVGSRQCTPYGEQMALEYGKALAKAGVGVVSGMARGIDGAGQRGALEGKGKTFGVLGCGVDICYPRENIGLYMDLQKQGGVISEQIPGTKPLPYHFPARNRIISALSDYVLVMEAREQSGSLITADMALEQGKDVYALPGPVTSPFSQGCHRLISQGAGILISPEDLLDEIHIFHAKDSQIISKNEKVLETPDNLVYSCLGFSPKGINQLAEETGFPAREVLQQLITLQMQGIVKEISKNYYVRIQ
ncbi:MAG: DNA-processing protein DprA [Lachnospiraceae bacterium]